MQDEAKMPLNYKERIMSTLKDPYDYIEWNPDLNHQIPVALDYGKEKRQRRKRIGGVGKTWIGHIYDLIVLFTLATVVAILLKLILN
jgi:hypothetical protein